MTKNQKRDELLKPCLNREVTEPVIVIEDKYLTPLEILQNTTDAFFEKQVPVEYAPHIVAAILNYHDQFQNMKLRVLQSKREYVKEGAANVGVYEDYHGLLLEQDKFEDSHIQEIVKLSRIMGVH